MRKLTLILTAALCLAAAHTAHAGWTNDPYNGMVSVCNAPGEQNYIKTCQLAGGRTIIAWCDDRIQPQQIYYQVLNQFGQPLLETNGRLINNGPWPMGWGTNDANLVNQDGHGGSIIVEYDNRNGSYDIYGQRYDSLGNRLWSDIGLPIAIWPGTESMYVTDVNADAQGNFFIAWYVGWPDANLYAQKFNALGQRLWGDYGVPVCTQGNTQRDMRIVPDNAGGLQAVWGDGRPNNQAYHLYFQHLDTRGNPYWTVNGIPLHDMSGNLIPEYNLGGISDGQSGSIWHTQNDAAQGVFFLLRVDGQGQTIWYWSNYISGEHWPHDLIRHPDGTFYMSDWNLYHFDINGNHLFGSLGLPLGGVLTSTSDGIIAGRSAPNGPGTREEAQRVDSTGHLTRSVPFAMSDMVQAFYVNNSAPDGADGVVYAFDDRRGQPSDWHNISAQRVNADGTLGAPTRYIPVPQPNISIILDPNPGNSGAAIRYTLSRSQPVNLSVYNILGARIATLMSGLQQPGAHVCSWDATLKPSGVYLLRLEAGTDIVVMKVMMVK